MDDSCLFLTVRSMLLLQRDRSKKKLPTSRDRRRNGSRDCDGTMGISDFCI
jgi:hypothetical protein